ncbi:hypothetical protein [Lacticaseibacillus porcinae]|uniref:hypothetical protein n=1 Tax=Lacticaseibacillus porcinae TaxID=1123687 RepID=UPI000F789028|nr:hypothetical protein [Lacticaseibacillus porcinae]
MLSISYLVLTMWWFHDDRLDQSGLMNVVSWTSLLAANGWYAWEYYQSGQGVSTISAVFIFGVASWKLWELWTIGPDDCDEEE